MRPSTRLGAGLTLVEIILSLGLLVIVIAAFGALATMSVNTTRRAKPDLVAQEAAARLAERMRSRALLDATDWYWDNAAITKSTIGGVIYATGGGGIQEVLDGTDGAEGLQHYYDQRLTALPLDGFPPLRVRFLNEQEYKTLWGFTSNAEVDLDFDGALGTGEAVTTGSPSYRMFPVLIEVHWSEGGDPRKHQLKTILVNHDAIFSGS